MGTFIRKGLILGLLGRRLMEPDFLWAIAGVRTGPG